jgi:hypothetical protein
VQALVAEIEEPVAETQVLRRLRVGVHGERHLLGVAQHLDLADRELDRAGREVRIHGVRRAPLDLAAERDDGLELERFHLLEDRARDVDHALRETVVIAQIHEQELPVVALAMDPAGEPHLLAGVRLAQLTTGVAAVVGPRHPR